MSGQPTKRPAKLVPYFGTGPTTPFVWYEQITAELPADPGERVELSWNGEHDLEVKFKDWLSSNYPKLVAQAPEAKPIPVERFDEFLIAVAETFGPRLFVCWPVVERLIRWHDVGSDAGVRNLKRFMEAVLRGTNLRRGVEGYGTVGPETKIGKERLVREAGRLREKIKATRSLIRQKLTFEDVVSTVRSNPDAFPFMYKNILSLRNFYSDSHSNREMVDGFISLNTAPAEFISEWLAWYLGRSSKSLDNMMGKLNK